MKFLFQKIAILIFSVLFFFCCTNTKKENKTENISSTNSRKHVEVTKIEDIDSLIIDTTIFPIYSTLTVKIITPDRAFHEEEVDSSFTEKEWFGVFKVKNIFKLSRTKLIAKRVNDPVADEDENAKTGWDISVKSQDTCLILIEKLPYLTERKIQSIKLPEYIYPNNKVKFSYLGTDYEIFATGRIKRDSADTESYEIFNYKLYLLTIIDGKKIIELLVSEPIFDDQMIKVIFAGDIDGDKRLDLIIDTSNDYNLTRPTIYLSKPAINNHIIKPIGVHESTGC